MSIKSAAFPLANSRTRFPTFGLRNESTSHDQATSSVDDCQNSAHEAVIVDVRGSLMPSQMVQSKLRELLDR